MKVSCICPTWNRPGWLEECIESFHRQDYQGEKELIVINDCPDRELIYNHPEVRIVNLKKKYLTLGQKYNDAFFNMAAGDIITPWEDNDIFLPHKISHGINAMQSGGLDYYKMPFAYFWNYGRIDEISNNLFWCAAFYTKRLLKKLGGCSNQANAAADQSIENRISANSDSFTVDNDPRKKSLAYYIYRWGGIRTHISGIPESPENMVRFQELNAANMRTGLIELRPHWETDYVELCAKFRRENGI